MIKFLDPYIIIETKNTSYVMKKQGGLLLHLYYGSKIAYKSARDLNCLDFKRPFVPGNSTVYDAQGECISLESVCLEVSSYGHGDLSTPLVEAEFPDKSSSMELKFKHAEAPVLGVSKYKGDEGGLVSRESSSALPYSYNEGNDSEYLKTVFEDENRGLRVEIFYKVFSECDVISRITRVTYLGAPAKEEEVRSSILKEEVSSGAPCNAQGKEEVSGELQEEASGGAAKTKQPLGEASELKKCFSKSYDKVVIKSAMSLQLDLPEHGYNVTTFGGAWAREMAKHTIELNHGRFVNSSFTGTSSNAANPFFMVSEPAATEESGRVFGFNLIYSGNHLESAEVNREGRTRILSGINPESFEWTLRPGESFNSPEAVMTFSAEGFTTLSHNMHTFVREHVVRGKYKKKVRPILLNSWEAAYFKITEGKLLRLAKKAAEAGIELFVCDDGWFGERDDDTKGLGEWEVNLKKFPNGLKGFAEQINALGMDFGIWVEPEMVNVNSNLYKRHPDWAVDIPGQTHSEGRNQRLLDLTKEEVRDYIKSAMEKVFSSANIAYVKWDFNRVFTDYYSKGVEGRNQKEFSHRYVLGLYEIMEHLTKKFPDILFEGCAAGGNRFDLGILSFFPQIWASDNTDALCRAEIQTGLSYGYPQSTYTSHVSTSPNHQTLRKTPLESRFNMACFGVLGYELNLVDLSREEFLKVKAQVALYKKWRKVLQYGTLYRGGFSARGTYGSFGRRISPLEVDGNLNSGNDYGFITVAQNKSKAVATTLHVLSVPNSQNNVFFAKGLDEQTLYSFTNIPEDVNIKGFGDLVNTASPVHIKNDSAMQRTIARFYKLAGEKEEVTAFGETLMNAGVQLSPNFAGVGFSEKSRYYPDFGSRMYFIEKQDG